MKGSLTSKQYLMLTAYLDGLLDEAAREKLEVETEHNPQLLEALTAMRQARGVMRQLKPRRVPHNFTLTPDMLPEKVCKTPAQRWLPFFRFSTAFSALGLILVFAASFLLQSAPAALMADRAIPIQAAAPEVVSEENAGSEAVQQAVYSEEALSNHLITWGKQAGYVPSTTFDSLAYHSASIHVEQGGKGGGGAAVREVSYQVSSPNDSKTEKKHLLVIFVDHDTPSDDETAAEALTVSTDVDYRVINSGPILGIRIPLSEPSAEEKPLPALSDGLFSDLAAMMPESSRFWLMAGLFFCFWVSLAGLIFLSLTARKRKS